MEIERQEVTIATRDGSMPAFFCTPTVPDRGAGILLLMEAFGLTSHIRDVAARLAGEGYRVLAPDLYYRRLPENKFGYDEVDRAMEMMYGLDFGEAIENDLDAALEYLRGRSDVDPDRIGVTGFCLGGGLSFLVACRFSSKIAAAAPFYGMVLDEWLAAVGDIRVPIYLFFGGSDPFIPIERIEEVESRLIEVGTNYRLKVYESADHGFFCDERSSYDPRAAGDAWEQVTSFFQEQLSLPEAVSP
jgi:carboxymethylenebutenolidase